MGRLLKLVLILMWYKLFYDVLQILIYVIQQWHHLLSQNEENIAGVSLFHLVVAED